MKGAFGVCIFLWDNSLLNGERFGPYLELPNHRIVKPETSGASNLIFVTERDTDIQR